MVMKCEEADMKIVKTVMIAALLFVVPAYAFSADLGYMRISLVEGDVQVKTPDAGDWGPASINGPLTEGDQVWVPQGSRVELQLNGGSFVRLDQNSALQILSMDRGTLTYSMMLRGGVSFRSIRPMRQPVLSTGRFSESICPTSTSTLQWLHIKGTLKQRTRSERQG